MPMNRKRYQRIKEATNWTCESCQRPCRRPGETDGELIDRIEIQHPEWAKDLYEWQETEEFGAVQIPKLTRFTLTCAHPNHDPENPEALLAAWCAPCHCRYDLRQMQRKQQLKREQEGQLNFFLIEELI